MFQQKVFSLMECMKSCVIAPTLHSSNWRVFAETLEFIRFHMKFHVKSAEFHEYELLGDHQV